MRLSDLNSRIQKGRERWKLDQLLKSRLFHRKLHEWGLLKIAYEIENIKGEELDWDMSYLNIDKKAWNKVIHNGIKPVRVFAHPRVLMSNPHYVSYYRMLAMVSQKSMSKVGLPVTKCEKGNHPLNPKVAIEIARHLNGIISDLINADEVIDAREFDLWRGMAAGAQAQGSWQNEKGKEAAKLINEIIEKHILKNSLGKLHIEDETHKFLLNNGRILIISSEPDIGIYNASGEIEIAVEIKGGIDTAGVLERLGAAIKSLKRAKRSNPKSITILILPSVAMTPTFIKEVKALKDIDYYFTLDELIGDPAQQKRFINLLGI